MPYYDYGCNDCGATFEKRVSSDDMNVPTTEPCPECGKAGEVVYKPTFSGIGDSIRLGIKRPPSEFINGVLGRMEASIPDSSRGYTKDNNGKTRAKNVSFAGSRFSPGRTV